MNILNPWIQLECRNRGVPEAAIPTHLLPSFAQSQEDLVLEALLASYCRRHVRPMSSLRYMEVGANHPIQTSNTYLFYAKYSARGVLVEANPYLIDQLVRFRAGDRVMNLAVAAKDGADIELRIAACSELSSVVPEHMAYFGPAGGTVGTVKVAATTLDQLLAAEMAEGCDLLTLDIEGLDLPVIEAASLAVVRPAFVMVEHSRDIFPNNDRNIISAMAAKRYHLLAESGVNLIFGTSA